MMIARHYRVFFYLLLVSVIGVIAFLYYQDHTSNIQKVSQPTLSHKHTKHRVRIRGFEFEGNYEGKRIISIKADSFTIEKKKLGYFRFGLVNVARFKNGVIDIYCRKEDSFKNAAVKSSEETTGGFQENPQPSHQGMAFKEVFATEVLPSFPMKRISSILLEPISLALHDETTLVTQITADSATIGLKQRSIVFKGHVKVASGSRTLKTELLVFFPENAILKTDRSFVLRTPTEEFNGAHLSADIFLSHVKTEQT